MSRAREDSNLRLLRARDAMDRLYPAALDVTALARIAHTSPRHFTRTFRETFGETPHRYLQRRRIERAMFLLRTTDREVTDVCFAVGFASLGSFSRTFRRVVGEPPSGFRRSSDSSLLVPSCFAMAWGRPLSFGEARSGGARSASASVPVARLESASTTDGESSARAVQRSVRSSRFGEARLRTRR